MEALIFLGLLVVAVMAVYLAIRDDKTPVSDKCSGCNCERKD